MAAKQIVTLKGQKDGIAIILDSEADFKEIKESLKKKVSQGKQFFNGADTLVTFKGRTLDDLSEKILIDIIKEETKLDITFTQNTDSASSPEPESGNAKVKGVAGKGETSIFSDIRASWNAFTGMGSPAFPKHGRTESPTIYHRGGLRSGQTIRHKGSVVVVGDVNPGSEIVADGNVIVLGPLKGMAHAGAAGDDTCFVSALILQPTQLRIAGIISYVPPSVKSSRISAALAYIKDGQVLIGPLQK